MAAGEEPRGWAGVSDADAVRALHRAVESGVTLFDTADVYGAGHSERLLCSVLAAHPEVLAWTSPPADQGPMRNPECTACSGGVDHRATRVRSRDIRVRGAPKPEPGRYTHVVDVVEATVTVGWPWRVQPSGGW